MLSVTRRPMKRVSSICLVLGLTLLPNLSWADDPEGFLVDDFEGPIRGGIEGTVDFGEGGDSSVEVSGSRAIKLSGEQAIKVVYEAVAGGYMWVARGYDLSVKGAGCWIVSPSDIDWHTYGAISFYMYGENSYTKVAFDLRDNGSEMWRFTVEDNFIGWRKIICPFEEFFARTDWQPSDADRNLVLDFPVKSFQFEPLPESKGCLYFDCVELVKK